MVVRLSKILLMAAIALWLALVAFGNLTDYGSNWPFVQHVLAMDTIFPGAGIHYRAITSPWLQRAAYALIIAAETFAAILCSLGAWRLWRTRMGRSETFHRAKRLGVLGVTTGLMLWLGGFMAVGGEWFGMWMSSQWNGLESAFRFVVVLLAALVYLGQRDDPLDE
ncbi:membrane protein [Dyella jiangningensis]|nr:membrane protein [Dyella jiangningensis]